MERLLSLYLKQRLKKIQDNFQNLRVNSMLYHSFRSEIREICKNPRPAVSNNKCVQGKNPVPAVPAAPAVLAVPAAPAVTYAWSQVKRNFYPPI